MALVKGEDSPPRPPAIVSYAFEKELINRQNRYIRLYDSFLPSLKRVPIAIKFWSKYDSTAAGRSGLPNFDRYCALVEKTIAEGPRDRYPEPVTESQWYVRFPEMPGPGYWTNSGSLLSRSHSFFQLRLVLRAVLPVRGARHPPAVPSEEALPDHAGRGEDQRGPHHAATPLHRRTVQAHLVRHQAPVSRSIKSKLELQRHLCTV